jgi:hypothetical protein
LACDGNGVCETFDAAATQCYTHAVIPAHWFQHNGSFGPVECKLAGDTIVTSFLESTGGIHVQLRDGYHSTFFAFDASGNEVIGCGQYPGVTATSDGQDFWSLDQGQCEQQFNQIKSYDVYGF